MLGRAKEWVRGGARLIDVRTAQEFEQGHIRGAVNVPLQDLVARVRTLGQQGDKLVVYCRSGGRSAQARQFLEGAGFQVCDLGPMSAWSEG